MHGQNRDSRLLLAQSGWRFCDTIDMVSCIESGVEGSMSTSSLTEVHKVGLVERPDPWSVDRLRWIYDAFKIEWTELLSVRG